MLRKYYLLSLLTTSLTASLSAQAPKFDNVWVMGYDWDFDPQGETYRLIFDTFPPRFEETPGALFIDGAYASICDSSGQLLFYTNNCRLADGEGALLANGDSLTFGWDFDQCKLYGYHPQPMHNLILPSPGKPDSFYLFHKSTYVNTTPPVTAYQNKFYYTLIDRSLNNGKGAVVSKHNIVLEAQMGYGQITAVRHGNGRDWWLPVALEFGNEIKMFLLSPKGISYSHSSFLGPEWNEDGSFQASFSQKGDRFVRYNRLQGLYLYDFDRCSGQFTGFQYFPVIAMNQGLRSGAHFSPDGRFLYLADYSYLYQYDLQAPDLLESRVTVAVYDGFMFNLWTAFSFFVPGPDGRLYVVPPHTTKAMHTINRPNLPGEACKVIQHELEFPNPYANPPNFPNFRLGPLDDSPCDTLGLNNLPSADFRPDLSDTGSRVYQFWDISAYAPDAWQWDFGDPLSAVNTSQEQHPLHTFSAPGFYTVCLTASNAYAADTRCKVVEVQAVSAPEAGDTAAPLHVYPNPTTGILQLPPGGGRERLAELFDWSGRRVFAATTVEDRLDLGRQAPGVYLLRLTQPDGRQVRQARIVIQR